jgi:multidrug/hemolysin transport system permease protein
MVMVLVQLVKRNILVYTRNRANIFFSLLSMIIIIGLMAIFLGKMNADGVVELLEEYGGVREAARDRANAEQLILMWTLAGIVVVNSVTITLALVGIMVEDEDQNKLSSFFVTPVNRTLLVIGYIISAILMGIIMCTLTVVIGEIYVFITGGLLLSIIQIVKILFYIILNVFTSASMVFLLANSVHSLSSFSGLSTIVGTLVGFMAAIYLPMGMLPNKVQMVLKCFPLLYGCSFMRDTFTSKMMATTFVGIPKEVTRSYKEYMGMTVTWNDEVINNTTKIAIMIISGILFIGISALLQKRRNVMKR